MLSKQLVNTIASANIEMRVLSEDGANLLRKTTKCNVCLKGDMFGGNSEALQNAILTLPRRKASCELRRRGKVLNQAARVFKRRIE